MPGSTAKKYRGSTRRLVISFDVGTTFSGVSYCFLEPGEEPKIFSVTRFPGQENVAGAPKVPSILYYDKEGNMRAAGAEVNSAENVERADEEEWIKVEWFKLRMRPKSMPTKLRSSTLPPLPQGKNLLQVFGDYMSYLMKCTSSFILDTHPNIPTQTFEQLRNKAEFIIAHPNGWEGAQQARLRKAAILGGLVPDTAAGKSRVSFVSEGEASLHYCIGEGLVGDEEKGFLIADLGGGTLDFSAYEITGVSPLRVREMAAAKCDLEGSSFVTLRGKGFLQKKLANSKYGTEEHIKLIITRFDETAKRTFRSTDELCLIQFGSVADQDPDFGIRRGNLRLTGADVMELFEPSITATVNAVRAQKAESKRPIHAVYLVGGFSASPYLISTLKQRLQSDGFQVSIPDSQTAKAVADGAISFYLDGHVSSRVARVTYGAPSGVPYNAFDPEHLRRTDFHRHLPSGRVVVNGGFEVVLERGTTVDEEKEFRRPFFDETTSWETLNNLTLDVIAYTGSGKPPKWIDETDPNFFKKVFKVQADTSTLQHLLQYQRAPDGTMYWRYDFALIIKFGSPELKAQLVWNENGVEKRSPAQIVYEEEVNPELDLDENDNGEDEGLDDRMDDVCAADTGLTARRDDGRSEGRDLADRMDRSRANDPVRRPGPIEPDSGRSVNSGNVNPDSPNAQGSGSNRVRAPHVNHPPPHLQSVSVSAQLPRRRASQIRPEVDMRDAPPAARPSASGSRAPQRSSRASVSSSASGSSRASRSSTISSNGGVTDASSGEVSDALGALLMQDEGEEEDGGDLPSYPDPGEDARRIATSAGTAAQTTPETQPDAGVAGSGNRGSSPPAYPTELLPFINNSQGKRPPPS